MKNICLLLLAVSICITVPSLANLPFNSHTAAWPDYSDTVGVSGYVNSLYSINIKAVRGFKQIYKNIEQETWYVIPGGFRAKFVDKGILYAVTYNGKGKWLSTVRQYSEKELPKDVRGAVKSIYYDYTITLVEEIEQPWQPIVYLVHMEDALTLKNIQFCDRQMETVLDIKKL